MKLVDYLNELKKVAPSISLARPAKAEALRELAKKCGVELPGELRQAWLQANGSRSTLFARPGYLTGYQLLSTAQAWREREALRRRAPQYADYEDPEPRDPRLQPGWFQPGWLPFAGFGGGTLLLLVDFSPAKKGRAGQIISFAHDPDRMDWVAPSFEKFLDASLAAIADDPQELMGEY